MVLILKLIQTHHRLNIKRVLSFGVFAWYRNLSHNNSYTPRDLG